MHVRQCGGRSLLYLIYRWLWALYFVGVILASWVMNKQGVKWLIWLTYWSFTLLVLNAVLQAVAVDIHFRRTADCYEGTQAMVESSPFNFHHAIVCSCYPLIVNEEGAFHRVNRL